MRNHADAIVACASWLELRPSSSCSTFVIVELGSLRILQCNVAAHPTAEWTLQQFREGLSDAGPYRFAIHDRDSIFSVELDRKLT